MRAYFFFILLAIILSSSCEDVIDVDLPTGEPKLVVNGIIRVDTTQEFVPVEIRFSESSNFFDDNTPTQVDQVFIIYGQPDPRQPELLLNVAFSNLAEEVPGSGIYTPDPNFSMDQRIRTINVFPGTVFILQVSHEGRRSRVKLDLYEDRQLIKTARQIGERLSLRPDLVELDLSYLT
ncbi:MAG: hypothetical protein AAGL29_13510, partial [Bacteroidota bacterium]